MVCRMGAIFSNEDVACKLLQPTTSHERQFTPTTSHGSYSPVDDGLVFILTYFIPLNNKTVNTIFLETFYGTSDKY